MGRIDDNELRALFEDIEAPPGLDRWRERIAEVHAESVEPEPREEQPEHNGAMIVALPAGRGLRPARHRRRSVAVAAAAAVVAGLAGAVLATQLFDEAPPADPTMIIDGPDKTDGSLPSPTARTTGPSGGMSSPPPSPGHDKRNPDGGPDNQPAAGGGVPVNRKTPTGNEPSWPPMAGDPSAANTGVPLGATLGDHYGDLRVTTAGQTVSDLRVTGTVIVDAPNVTLKRILVVAPQGAAAVRQNANGLTIVDSELSGGTSLTQGAADLTVRRSRLETGVSITSGAQLYDSYLHLAEVLVSSGASQVLLRHNTFGGVTMNDLDGPIRGVIVENNLLTQVNAPKGAGSASIHVLSNRFRGNAPSTDWNASAADYRWSDNTFADSGAPAYP